MAACHPPHLLGALCHLPFLIHSQQLFLPVWLLAFFVTKRGLDLRNVALKLPGIGEVPGNG